MEKEQGLLYTAETKPEREWHYGSMLYAYDLTTNQHHSFESDLPEGTYSLLLYLATNCCFWGMT